MEKLTPILTAEALERSLSYYKQLFLQLYQSLKSSSGHIIRGVLRGFTQYYFHFQYMPYLLEIWQHVLFVWYTVHMYFDLWGCLGITLLFTYQCTNCINISAMH